MQFHLVVCFLVIFHNVDVNLKSGVIDRLCAGPSRVNALCGNCQEIAHFRLGK